MRLLLLFFFVVKCVIASAQYHSDTTHLIKVHFLYGSKPAKGFKKTEPKWFGGIHGGHVSIELDSLEIGFAPTGDFHIFAHRKNLAGKFYPMDLTTWTYDTTYRKYLSITVPLTNQQYQVIQSLHREYLAQSPYDYAFFGMRCAAATYDILSRAGLFPVYSNRGNIIRHFYPKPLRKKMIRWASTKGYTMHTQPGSKTRKWEKD